jgi:hypothetical protein
VSIALWDCAGCQVHFGLFERNMSSRFGGQPTNTRDLLIGEKFWFGMHHWNQKSAMLNRGLEAR